MGTSDRLDSWKEIAAYLDRGVRTAQRWQRTAALPVRRIPAKRGSVFAFKSEIDAWWRTQRTPPDDAPAAPTIPSPIPTVESAADIAARYHSSRSAGPTPMRVRAFLSQTATVDPDFPLAHADLAMYFFTLVAMGLLPPTEGMPAARGAAQRALDLDPSMSEAHGMLGLVSALYEGRWTEAERRFHVALSARPVRATIRFHYAIWYLSPLGQHESAIAELRTALADDPLYLLGRVQVAMESLSLGREEGRDMLRRVIDIDPHFGPALGLLCREQALRGEIDEALQLAERCHAALPQHPNAIGDLAGMYRRTGHTTRARDLLDSLSKERPWARPRAEAAAHLVNGEFAAAIEAVRAAVAERDPGVWLLFAGTSGTHLRATRGWPSVAATLKLPRER